MSNLSKVILGTGNYYDVKSGNTVSVTGDGGNAWGYFGPAYKKLAPKLVTYTPYAERPVHRPPCLSRNYKDTDKQRRNRQD